MDNTIYRCLWNGKQCRKIGEPLEVIGQKFEYVSNGHWFYITPGRINSILTEQEWLVYKKNKK